MRSARPFWSFSGALNYQCPYQGQCQLLGQEFMSYGLKTKAAYRVFYTVVTESGVLVFHAFQKKTEKTPLKEIELGKKRLKELKELLREEN